MGMVQISEDELKKVLLAIKVAPEVAGASDDLKALFQLNVDTLEKTLKSRAGGIVDEVIDTAIGLVVPAPIAGILQAADDGVTQAIGDKIVESGEEVIDKIEAEIKEHVFGETPAAAIEGITGEQAAQVF